MLLDTHASSNGTARRPLRAGRHRYHSLSSQREKYSQVAGDMRPPGMHSPATGHSPHGMLVRAKEVG